MKPEAGKRRQQTVLIVADDLHILILAQAVLIGKGYRVLMACGAQHAVRLLKLNRLPVTSVAILAGMRGYTEVQSWSLRRGAISWTFRGAVDEHRVLLEGLESGADWESAIEPAVGPDTQLRGAGAGDEKAGETARPTKFVESAGAGTPAGAAPSYSVNRKLTRSVLS